WFSQVSKLHCFPNVRRCRKVSLTPRQAFDFCFGSELEVGERTGTPGGLFCFFDQEWCVDRAACKSEKGSSPEKGAWKSGRIKAGWDDCVFEASERSVDFC